MKKKTLILKLLFTIFSGVLISSTLGQYNNEWIDYNKVYYTFKVGASGMYRIPYATLQSNGLSGTRAEHFQLWRNGKEVPMFSSISNGTMGTADYLEFYGLMNDGSLDAQLYKRAAFQLADKWSLQTDTSSYFLTVNTASSNLRLVNATNDVSGNSLSPESYFMYTFNNFYRDQINPGYASQVGSFVYSSLYDNGEGWTSRAIQSNSPIIDQRKDLYVAPVNVSSTLSVSAYGNALNSRKLQVFINGNLIVDQTMVNFTAANQKIDFSSTILGRATDTVRIVNNTSVASDRVVVAKYTLTYPRQFNFGGLSLFEFSLPASASGNFIEITNFNNGSVPPVLYDLTSNRRYIGDILLAGKVRFALPAGGLRNFVLMSTAGSIVGTVTGLQKRQFVNFLNSANQGNYLIISHASISQSKNGNALENYRAYRSSAAGGGYQTRVVDIDELVDQFAYGVKKHPLSVKNFLRFARKNFSNQLKYVLLVGKGITYDQYRLNESRSITEKICLVPTFGNPGSDNLLVSDNLDPVPATSAGRISVVSGDELNDYLEKIKQHDQAIASPSQTIKEKAWMKNMAHVVGGGDPYLQSVIDGYMNSARAIAEDTSYGAKVYTFNKITPSGLELINSGALSSLFSEGLGLITYFGHSSANNMEFNLNDPSIFSNAGKYPLFIANGCNAGNFFIYDTLRFTQSNKTITEDYVLIPQNGSIGFISSTHFGIVNYLNLYTKSFYKRFSNTNYPSTVGESQLGALRDVVAIGGTDDFFNVITAEQILLGGDPAAKIYSYQLPDYVVEDPLVKITPFPLSISNPFFKVTTKIQNIGRYVKDSLRVRVNHILPDGSIKTLFNSKIASPSFADSLSFSVQLDQIKHKGQNKIEVILDPDNTVVEISKSNNQINKLFSVSEDEVRPVYPSNFAIVSNLPLKLVAGTNKFSKTPSTYVMELDTTNLFNSPSKISMSQLSYGGTIEYSPSLNQIKDSTVFYWRVSKKPDTGNIVNWSSSSFVFLPKSSPGWNQSHVFQYQQNSFESMGIEDRSFRFNKVSNTLTIQSGIFPNWMTSISRNTEIIKSNACSGSINSLQFMIFDLFTGNYQNNEQVGSSGLYGSMWFSYCSIVKQLFDFSYNTVASRKSAMDFFDKLPNGKMIVMTNWSNGSTSNQYINRWKEDTLANGSGNSLYHKLKAIGFTKIDSFYRNIPFTVIAVKDNAGKWTVQVEEVGNTPTDILTTNYKYEVSGKKGVLLSPPIGPALTWGSVHWSGFSNENPTSDKIRYTIMGIDKNYVETKLFSSEKTQIDTSIANIDAQRFPYMRIIQENTDSTSNTPYQLKYFQVKYKEIPEGAITITKAGPMKDTLEVGEPIRFAVAFKNVSATLFDSLKVFVNYTDAANSTKVIFDGKRKPLPPGDTIVVDYSFDSKNVVGSNAVYVNFNPDNAQQEQFLYNNYLSMPYVVIPDKYPPNLDVTFDGVHIMNKDIVSSKPSILISLKDNNRFLLLNDTSLFSIMLRYPNGQLRKVAFHPDTLTFTPPANSPGNVANEAVILFKPVLVQDGEYELIVTAKDRSDNQSGATEYRVIFETFNKQMVSELFNYPNPFTTSTAFAFLLTGSKLPYNIRIQILTITGKIVKEIAMNELGSLKIGRNITEYKWDGTDQFGQPLANGVYLYRVMVQSGGIQIEKYSNPDVNLDRYFKSGYGKMYLMR